MNAKSSKSSAGKTATVPQAVAKIIGRFGKHETDTGSSAVQVALLTERINELQAHFKEHPKDKHSRRGLLHMVNQRRKHLDYLKRTDADRYQNLLKELKLRR